MHKLNIQDLHRTLNDLNNKHSECFEKIVESCHKKILSQTRNKRLNCFYEVPLHVIGFPIYDIGKSIEYLKKSLEVDGFLVKYFFPNFLYISWDFEEIKNEKDNNPVIQNKKVPFAKMLEHKPSGKCQLRLF